MFLFVEIYSTILMHVSRYPKEMNYLISVYSFLALSVAILGQVLIAKGVLLGHHMLTTKFV